MEEEQYGLQAAYVILAIAFGIYLTMKPLMTYLLRRRLLELSQWSDQWASPTDQKNQASSENVKWGMMLQVEQKDQSPLESLKWGLILLFTGIGFIIVHFLPVSTESSLTYGIIMVSAAIGFLVYYQIAYSRIKSN